MKTTKAEINHFLAGSVYREPTISGKVVFCLMRLGNVRVNGTERTIQATQSSDQTQGFANK